MERSLVVSRRSLFRRQGDATDSTFRSVRIDFEVRAILYGSSCRSGGGLIKAELGGKAGGKAAAAGGAGLARGAPRGSVDA